MAIAMTAMSVSPEVECGLTLRVQGKRPRPTKRRNPLHLGIIGGERSSVSDTLSRRAARAGKPSWRRSTRPAAAQLCHDCVPDTFQQHDPCRILYGAKRLFPELCGPAYEVGCRARPKGAATGAPKTPAVLKEPAQAPGPGKAAASDEAPQSVASWHHWSRERQ